MEGASKIEVRAREARRWLHDLGRDSEAMRNSLWSHMVGTCIILQRIGRDMLNLQCVFTMQLDFYSRPSTNVSSKALAGRIQN
jgi:hypothetical protein